MFENVLLSNCESDITQNLSRELMKYGLEVYPFKVGWYNDAVRESFKLEYEYDCLAYLCISIPKMFENLFIPFLLQNEEFSCDPFDQCMKVFFDNLKKKLENSVEVIHDFDMYASNKPKILMQVAGHITGATYYYQRTNLTIDPWPKDQKIAGVCIHPKYGGWFAFRSVLIFRYVTCMTLSQMYPLKLLQDENQIVELLKSFNFQWRNGKYRNAILVNDKYSVIQLFYFLLKPHNRKWLIDAIRSSYLCYSYKR